VAALALGGIGGLTFAKGWFDTGWASKVNEIPTEPSHSLPWFICCELALCIAAGLFVLGLAIKDSWETRSSESLFLGLWVRVSRPNREEFPKGAPLHMPQFRLASESPDAM